MALLAPSPAPRKMMRMVVMMVTGMTGDDEEEYDMVMITIMTTGL